MTALSPFIFREQGVLTVGWSREPNYAAGNAQFFDPNPACLIQLRPLLPADYGEHGPRGSNAFLFVRNAPGPDLAFYVRVPPAHRKNTRAGVMRAIKRVERFDREIGARIREVAARTRWPEPVPRTFA